MSIEVFDTEPASTGDQSHLLQGCICVDHVVHAPLPVPAPDIKQAQRPALLLDMWVIYAGPLPFQRLQTYGRTLSVGQLCMMTALFGVASAMKLKLAA